MSKQISITVECRTCKATGLYAGFAERDGAAVVCLECDGKGYKVLKGTPFTERKKRCDIVRVFPLTGIVVTPEIKGGVTYEEFLQDSESPSAIGNEPREYACPLLSHNSKVRGCDLFDKCESQKLWGKHVSECGYFDEKAKCWETFDELMRKDEKP